jgi:hypothetical protein
MRSTSPWTVPSRDDDVGPAVERRVRGCPKRSARSASTGRRVGKPGVPTE